MALLPVAHGMDYIVELICGTGVLAVHKSYLRRHVKQPSSSELTEARTGHFDANNRRRDNPKSTLP